MHEAAARFDWDAGNRTKCQKHGVTLEQIEDVLRGSIRVFPDPAHSAAEVRRLGIGRTGGRYVLVAFTLRVTAGERFIRPISARFMHAKEIKHYESQVEGLK